MYVLSIFPPTPHLSEHVCPMDNLLIPAASQGWHDPDSGCPTVAHTPQLWFFSRRATFGTSTTPGAELFPGSTSPRAPLSIQLVKTTRNPQVRSRCPTLPECCCVLLNSRPAGTAFRRSVKDKSQGKCVVNKLKFRIARSSFVSISFAGAPYSQNLSQGMSNFLSPLLTKFWTQITGIRSHRLMECRN